MFWQKSFKKEKFPSITKGILHLPLENFFNMWNITKIATGVAGLAFIGYCIYFDRQRTQDVNYKENLKSKRKEERKIKEMKKEEVGITPEMGPYGFLIQEFLIADHLLTEGNIKGATKHLANVMNVIEDKQVVLTFLEVHLSSEAFEILSSIM